MFGRGRIALHLYALSLAGLGGIVYAQHSDDVIIEVPDLFVIGRPAPREVIVTVPDLVVIGQPAPQEVVVNVTDLVIVGRPTPKAIEVDVPDFVVVGEPEQRDIGVSRAIREMDGLEETPDNEAGTKVTAGFTETWCHGNYSVILSKPRFVPNGPPIGRQEVVAARVEAQDCAQILEVSPFPGRLDLARGDDDVFTGSTVGDEGQSVHYSLTCHIDLSITGQLEASDGNMIIQRDIIMERTGGEEADLSGCEQGSGHTLSEQ